ncbi:MAG: hypothetical protein ACRDA5_07295 [Clostridium sp.]
MKKGLILGLALMFGGIPTITVLADTGQPSIEINGEYSDWVDKPGVSDASGDTTGGTDLEELKFYREENLLYLNIKRYPNKATEQWNLRIPIINADPKYGTVPVFLPWDEIKDENGNGTGVWPNNDNPTQEVAYLVTISYREDWDPSVGDWGEMVNMMQVTVSLENNRIDYLYKCIDTNETEFALDLSWVGLGDDTSEVEFAVGSNTDADVHGNIDWISENGPIKITDGPIFGALTVVITMSSIFAVAFLANKKRKNIEI